MSAVAENGSPQSMHIGGQPAAPSAPKHQVKTYRVPGLAGTRNPTEHIHSLLWSPHPAWQTVVYSTLGSVPYEVCGLGVAGTGGVGHLGLLQGCSQSR